VCILISLVCRQLGDWNVQLDAVDTQLNNWRMRHAVIVDPVFKEKAAPLEQTIAGIEKEFRNEITRLPDNVEGTFDEMLKEYGEQLLGRAKLKKLPETLLADVSVWETRVPDDVLDERGVCFVQAYPNDQWDAHKDLRDNHDTLCGMTDQPVAALLTDLKRRGLLEQTLVVWGGEFGHLPISEKGVGRDHNPYGFLMWMAGGGIKGGTSFGETDEIGYKPVSNPVSIQDLHATILHLIGLDHERLTYQHNGRDFRLTDVSGNVIKPILA